MLYFDVTELNSYINVICASIMLYFNVIMLNSDITVSFVPLYCSILMSQC